MTNCSCLGTPTVVTPPSCPGVNTCLIMSNIIVACKDAVGPCGAIGTLNFITPLDPLKPYCHNLTGCGNTPIKFSLRDWDKTIFASVSLSNSTITWTTKGVETINKFGVVEIKACCGELASIFKITICVKDLCKCNSCTVNQSCEACTGNCVAKLLDVSVGDSQANIEISLS